MDLSRAHRPPAGPRAAALAGLLWCGLLLGAALAAPAGAAERPGGGEPAWTSPLGPRPVVVVPFDAPAGPYAAGHRGADLAGVPGATAVSAGAGVVAFAGRVAGLGVVSVDHADGLRTTYQPLAAVVRRGDQVRAGQPLGLLEAAGSHCPPGACLHWGLRRGPAYLDPLTLLGTPRVRLLPVWGGEPPLAGSGAPPAPGRTGAASAAAVAGGDHRAVDDGHTPLVPAGAAVAVAGLGAAALFRRRAPPA